jgi:sugar (pentulose or hexulose) kinase
MHYIGIDLGTTFIKGAVLDLDDLSIRQVERFPFPEPVAGLPPSFREFQPDPIVAATRGLLERLLRFAPDAGGIVMCSQLHGLVFVNDDGCALSNFISWQDQRALEPMATGTGSYFDAINHALTPEDRRQLGNEPRPGVPLCFLYWLAQNHPLPGALAIAADLPGFVVANLCRIAPTSDATRAAAYGALNVANRAWHRPVIEKLGLGSVRWPEVVPQAAVVGHYRFAGRQIPVHAPVGDYHCSQVGAFLDEGELSVNISTGSAVIRLAQGCEAGGFQTRPWFDGRYLKTITHIPGGRALNALLRLLSELAQAQGLQLKDPWDWVQAEADKIRATDLRVDPAFYFSAMGDRGCIQNVREENLTVGHLFHAAFTGMADNYTRCATRIAPDRDWTRVVFSGGWP